MKLLATCCLSMVVAVALHANGNAQGRAAPGVPKQVPIVVFVCEHGAAKSVIAAAHFNRLAKERNVRLRAIARGTNPDEKIAPAAAKGLQSDGVPVGIHRPKRLSTGDVARASRVVAMCELPDAYSGNGARVEHWNDIPSVSDDYSRARDAIVERVRHLLDKLREEQ